MQRPLRTLEASAEDDRLHSRRIYAPYRLRGDFNKDEGKRRRERLVLLREEDDREGDDDDADGNEDDSCGRFWPSL